MMEQDVLGVEDIFKGLACFRGVDEGVACFRGVDGDICEGVDGKFVGT